MKLWEKIFIGIGIILSIFIIMTIRKFVIYTNLNYLNKEQQESGNIYCKVTVEQQIIETYTKGNIQKMILTGNGRVITQITKPEERILYEDDGVNKTRREYKRKTEYVEEIDPENKIANFADFTTLPEKIWSSICSHIKTEKIDEQEYYVISGRNENFFARAENTKNMKVYINKDTGLTYKFVETLSENGKLRDRIVTYEYKFNVVTDEDVAELDEQEYKIKR